MIRPYLLLSAVLVSAACASTHTELSVHTSYPPGVDFRALHAFRVATEPASASDTDVARSPRLDRLTRAALRTELTARGFEAIEDGPPDFRVAWQLTFRNPTGRAQSATSSVADPLPPTTVGGNPDGTLEVTILDPATLRVLWHGTVSGIRVDPLRPEGDLRIAVRRLLVEFPPLAAAPSGG